MSTITKRLLVLLLAVAFVAAACGSDGGDSDSDESGGAPAAPTCDQEGTLNVPDDFDTIQAAADAAAPGALVLIAEGTYEEAVNVTCPDITLRGVDRNNVVLEGNFELENGIRILETDRVVVENMTARTTPATASSDRRDGYRGSYLTAIRNGDYGVRLRLGQRGARALLQLGTLTPASTSASAATATPSSMTSPPSGTASATRARTPPT